jgi:hypothetical protein
MAMSTLNPRFLASIAMILLMDQAVAAQHAGHDPANEPVYVQPSNDVGFEMVDQSVNDVGPLSESQRFMDAGLQIPTGFSKVFKVPGRDDLFMRANGGLYMVYPRSQYVESRQGTYAEIPQDTTFYIGLPSLQRLAPEAWHIVPQSRFSTDDRPLYSVETRIADLDQDGQPINTERPQASSRAIRFGVSQRPVDGQAPPRRIVMPPPTDGQYDNTVHARWDSDVLDVQPAEQSVVNDPQYRARRLAELMARAAEAHDDAG